MCGRFTLAVSSSSVIEEYFSVDASVGHADLSPRYNIAPSQDITVIVKPDAESGRVLTMMRWGLVPHWAKDIKIGYKMINAKAETLAEKPAYRTAYKKRCCLIPTTGFYEWQHAMVKSNRTTSIAMMKECWLLPDSGNMRASRSIRPRPLPWMPMTRFGISMTGCPSYCRNQTLKIGSIQIGMSRKIYAHC